MRRRLQIKSSRVKTRYDKKARAVNFIKGERVWFYNPRRFIGKSPKLQRDWEGPFVIIRKLGDVVYSIRRKGGKLKIVHADRLAVYTKR